MFRRILALIHKEMLTILRDKKSRRVLIVPVFAQLFIFAFAATLDVQNVTIGILNRDYGEQAFEFVQRFHGAPTFKKIIHLQSISEITPFINNQEGIMVVSIDEQFSRNLDSGKTAEVQFILDGRKSNASQIVAGYAQDITSQFNRDFAARAGLVLQNTVLVPQNWFNPNLIFLWKNVPCLTGILTMLITTILTGLSIAREKELGTFEQLLVSPLLPTEIIIGKTVPSVIIGMIEGAFIVAVAIFIFRIPFTGSVFLLFLSMFVFIMSIVSIGLFISALCSTQQQTLLGTFLFMAPSVLLSGYITPIENMPGWFQPLTYLIPLKYYIVIVQGLFSKAMPFNIVLLNLWPMILIGSVTLTCAVLFTRRKLG